MYFNQFVLVVSVLVPVYSQSTPCPEASSIHPCICFNRTLDCSAVTSPDQFRTITGLKEPDTTLHFGNIVVKNSELNEIPAKAFGRATAEEYWITDNKYLTSISSGFMNPEADPTSIILLNNSLESFPFSDLKRLKRIQHLIFNHNQLTEIPPGAFKDVGPDSVVDIIFTNNSISKIGREAFAGRKDKINAIVLNNNKLEHLTSESLCLDSRPNHFVFAYNQISKVDADAFGSPDTCGSNFAVQTVLAVNKLTTLRINQFLCFLRKLNKKGNSTLEVGGNPFTCDCNMIWLLRKGYTSSLVNGINCKNFNGRPLSSLSIKDLKNCDS